MNNKFHPFHMVSLSPWPILSSVMIMNLVMSMSESFNYSSNNITLTLNIMSAMIMAISWWRDVIRESLKQGFHHYNVINGLKMGMILFITSEVLFFVSFFWSYFHNSISPNVEMGQSWPPYSISPFNPMNVPLLNTIILLSSGVSVTWSHHAMLLNKKKLSEISLMITCMLGMYFSILQGMEYWQAMFSISDSSYGSSFFMATGFHGIHVLIGTTFLIICLIRLNSNHNNMNHILGFEMAAWYWHFVDVVWLFLYSSIYWWGF